MELEVRVVSGIDNCFASLPLNLIDTLQSTRSAHLLPQVLSLELRSRSNQRWVFAWSGATSSSSSIEVAQQFAECISLADGTIVQVRVISDVPKATLVTIEPLTEDDWEVLELNSEHAEAAILNQVRIVHDAMRFPLWLHGRAIITFHVVSTFPKKPVVQLVPGTEVAVAPKRRKNKEDTFMPASNESTSTMKALLRVQDSGEELLYKCHVKGIELGVALTSVALVNPETAEIFSLRSLQLVAIVPRLSSKESSKNPENTAARIKSNSTAKEISSGASTDNKKCCQAIVRLLFSESVAKGHVKVAQSLRRYLNAGLHSWVYLMGCSVNFKKEIPMVSLSPCHFKMLGKDKDLGVILEVDKKNHKKNKILENSSIHMGDVDWSAQGEVIAALSSEPSCKEDEEAVYQSENKGLACLLYTWLLAQLNSIASNAGSELNTLLLPNETLVHFEVKGYKSGSCGKAQASCNGALENKNKARALQADIFYILTIAEESLHNGKINAYELILDKRDQQNNDMEAISQLFGKLNSGDPVSFYYVKEKGSSQGFNSVSSLTWMGPTASDVINRIEVLLSPDSSLWFSSCHLPLPGHILIHGPSGSGKTSLAKAVAKSLEEHKDLPAHIVFVSCSGLSLEKGPTIRQSVSNFISEALDHAPSIVIFDDLDSIISSSSDPEGSQPSTSIIALTKFLVDVMDEYGEKRKRSCGIGPVAFIASAQSLDNLPQALTSSGRFDFHVQLPAPAASERKAILEHEIRRRSLECSDEILLDVASRCDGYDAYDLEILVDRTVHAAVGRYLHSDSGFGKRVNPNLVGADFSQAMHEFLPVAMRDITKASAEGGRSGWDDVGGLTDIQNSIKEMIELPSKFPKIFARAPLRLRSNVLLYGPPGCGKTHIVGAAAAACSLRFISIKGPELLNKYIGASEQAVRDIFSKATAAAPCLLFFDEFDSIAPKRGHDNTGVTDRVVNQFLTELDGVEVLTGVFVFAATSRPDLLDAALLRPGRLDRLLFCDFPSPHERLDILKVLSKKLPLADDVDLEVIAHETEGFSGADLQALLSDAQLAAVHEILNNSDSSEPGKMPVITHTLVKSIASKARPSVSETEKKRLYSIYSQFLDSKKSVAAQSREAKGKRATLA